MPRDIRRHRHQKFRDSPKLFIRIIEPGNHKGHDFHPHAFGVKQSNGVQNLGKFAAQRPVVFVVKSLEVHLVKINPGLDILNHLGRAVAVGNIGGIQAFLFGLFKNFHRPLAGDQRFIISACHNPRTMLFGQIHKLFGRDFFRLRARGRISESLRRHPILAIRAVKIASQHTEAHGLGAGKRVKKRFLFNRIHLKRGDITGRD